MQKQHATLYGNTCCFFSKRDALIHSKVEDEAGEFLIVSGKIIESITVTVITTIATITSTLLELIFF
jgi:hypothetical protein